MDGKGEAYTLSNGDGTSQYLPHLELEGEPSKIEQEALDRKIKLGKANEFTVSVINNCARSGAKHLDLSRKSLTSIPDELLTLTHIEVRKKSPDVFLSLIAFAITLFSSPI